MTDIKPVTTGKQLGYRVVPFDGLWKVAMPGDSVAVSLHPTKLDAIASALARAREEHGPGVLVYRADGNIETIIEP